MKKIIFILILFLSCYIIYNLTVDSKYYYLSFGDCVSSGLNKNRYVSNYLEKSDKLKKYNDSFVNCDYRITDLINILKYNETKVIDNKKYNLNQLLKKADVVTLSIGMNELYYKLNNDSDNIYNYMNNIINDMNELLGYIDNFNYEIVFVLGYYNVGVEQEYVNYINAKLNNIVSERGYVYIDLSNYFDNNPMFLSKNGSFLPNNEGYLKISKIIIEKLENY